jgi:hypothetical protein
MWSFGWGVLSGMNGFKVTVGIVVGFGVFVTGKSGVRVGFDVGMIVDVGVFEGRTASVAGWQAEKRNVIKANNPIFFICTPRNIIN